MMATNIYQFLRADSYRQLLRDYWRFASVMVIFLLFASFYAAGLGNDIIRLLIAISVMVFTLNNLFGLHWRLLSLRWGLFLGFLALANEGAWRILDDAGWVWLKVLFAAP